MTAASPHQALCRFYTRPDVGEVLVGLLGPDPRPARILDLASGGGILAAAAARRWRGAELVTVDIDPGAATHRFGFRRHRHVVADALDVDLPRLIDGDGFDVALCNPPYRMPRWRPGFERILGEAGFADAVTPDRASAEVLFVAQNLRLARAGGRIGLLLPDGLVSGRRSAAFRAALLRDHCIEAVVQLPMGAFVGTDARAFIVILEKGRGTGLPIALRRLDGAGVLGPVCLVAGVDAVERMDHDFHALAGRGRGPTLADLGASVVRGSVESPRGSRVPVFHTSHFPTDGGRWALHLPQAAWSAPRAWTHAGPGDILLARVDRRLERKVCGVTDGTMPISSSVFRIRVPAGTRDAVLRALLSPAGEARLAATARGVGARMLGKGDLLDMCLPL